MQVPYLFDVRTVALFIAMTFFVQATAIGAQAFLIRELKQYRGVGAAVVANLCVAAGLMLRLFADRLPAFFILPADLLILLGPALFYVALGQFTGLGYSKVLVIGILLSTLAFLVYFMYRENNVGIRTVIFSVATAVLVFVLIYQLWRTSRTLLQFSAYVMLIPFVIYGLFMIGRTISIALEPPQEAFSNSPAQSATYLLSFALSFFWSTGFILMVSQRLRNDLLEMATVDVLTRIPNRRATQAFLEKELSRAQRQNDEFSVLLIDIDDFKQVNDRWGHTVGDEVLARTASLFQSMIRKQDLVGRWGGEEFLIVVPGPCEAHLLAERVRSAIAAVEYHKGSNTFHITVSIGIACGHARSIGDEILKEADDALYKAKLTKNAVSVTG